jgi:hypothetical protein
LDLDSQLLRLVSRFALSILNRYKQLCAIDPKQAF